MSKMPIVRMAPPEWQRLRNTVFRRYPDLEWATFARFGWRETGDHLVLTLAETVPPQDGDLDEQVGHVAINEPYTLRTALSAEKHSLAVGIIHSHPADCRPIPSRIDDDMDSYYSRYFGDFAPGRPYVSLIASTLDGELALSGRVFWRGSFLPVHRFAIERTLCDTWIAGHPPSSHTDHIERTQRLSAALGLKAASRLRNSTVAVIGAGGTGSAAIEVLARAGVGRLIIVDPDKISESNLERVHGSLPAHASAEHFKVALAAEHVKSIAPACMVEAIAGGLPQSEVIDSVVTADVMVGCTDQQHSRLAISDIANRFLIPTIDSGVVLEGTQGRVTGQVIQLVRFLASDPCALCRNMVDPSQLSQELMHPEERKQRQRAALDASATGGNGNAYWRELPQLNTVGYLTTTAGAMLAGYAIGWLTGTFEMPFERLQMNLCAPFLDVTDQKETARPECTCGKVRGWADQAEADAMITAPQHWPAAKVISDP